MKNLAPRLLIIGIAWILVAPAYPATLVVLVNAHRPESNLSLADLRRISSGEMLFWKDRSPIRLVLPPRDSAACRQFLLGTLGTTPPQFIRTWETLRFRGEALTIPVMAASESLAIRAVNTNQTFLVVVERSILATMDTRVLDGVKILTVDAKDPDHPGYPLR